MRCSNERAREGERTDRIVDRAADRVAVGRVAVILERESMTETEKKQHEVDAKTLINLLESVDGKVLEDAWISMHPIRKQAIKRKLMPLAFK